MEELTALPGVARKTANVVLSNGFGINAGVVVDTHVKRLSRRLRFTRHEDVAKIEQDLMRLFPQERWLDVADLLIFHGRRVCDARRPRLRGLRRRAAVPQLPGGGADRQALTARSSAAPAPRGPQPARPARSPP